MPPQEDKGPLARAQERLYAPSGGQGYTVPTLAQDAPPPAAERWAPPPPPPPPKPKLPRVTLFLIGAGVFFALATIVAAGLILFGGRTVSTENITITTDGSPTAGSGDMVTFTVRITNENPVPLSGTMLSATFPEGTRSPENLEAELSHLSDTVGDIPAGGSVERSISAVVFGSEGQRVTLPIRFEYRTPGATSAFIKEATHSFTITTSPLSVSVGSLAQVSAGQPFDIAVAVRSNAATPIPHAALIAEVPPGFTLRDAQPAAAVGSLFDLGTIAPGEEKLVKLTGTLAGEDRDARVFRFTAGTRENERSTTLAVSYTSAERTVLVEKPFLAPTLTLNRETSASQVLRAGEPVQGSLSFVNTLDTVLTDATVVVTLAGSGLDPASVASANGFYRSSDSTITFSKETLPALARLTPGQTGNGAFSFSVKESAELRQPLVNISISVSGKRMNERNVPTTISSTVTRSLKVATALSLTGEAMRTGPIANTGPIPPKADAESTYTVKWTFGNTVNSVGGAVATAVLPSYVRFTGTVRPADASVTYNEATRTVTWNAGDVPAGTAAKEAYFQVAITPSASQRGTSPVILQGSTYAGTDRFTGDKLTGSVPELTTLLPSSPTTGQVQ